MFSISYHQRDHVLKIRNSDGRNAFHLAVQYNRTIFLQSMVQKAYVDGLDYDMNSPIMLKEITKENAELLLEHGANILHEN